MYGLWGFQWRRPIESNASKKIRTDGFSFSLNSTRRVSMEIDFNDKRIKFQNEKEKAVTLLPLASEKLTQLFSFWRKAIIL